MIIFLSFFLKYWIIPTAKWKEIDEKLFLVFDSNYLVKLANTFEGEEEELDYCYEIYSRVELVTLTAGLLGITLSIDSTTFEREIN